MKVQVFLDDDLVKYIDEIATQNGSFRSSMIREWVIYALRREYPEHYREWLYRK